MESKLMQSQRGAVLLIALIVLVAMTLAGIAMMRSVDTATVVAGNIAFKQSSVNAADQGLQTGFAYLQSKLGSTTLYSDDAAAGYKASVSDVETLNWWTDPANWAGAKTLTADAAGNVVSVLIHRMCPIAANCKDGAKCGGVDNICGTTPDASMVGCDGCDMSQPNFFTKPPAVHYRITSRAVGPRNSVTVVQTMLRFN